MKRLIVLIFCCVSLNAEQNATATIEHLFSLEELNDYAIGHRTDYQAIDQQIAQSAYDEQAALGAYLPQIGVTGIFESSEANIYPIRLGTLSFSQLLLDSGIAWRKMKIARLQKHISECRKVILHDQIEYDTRKSFIYYATQKWNNPYYDALKKSSPVAFTRAKRAGDVGLISSLEFDSARATYAQDQSNLAISDEEEIVARTRLSTTVERKIQETALPSLDEMFKRAYTLFESIPLENYFDDAMINRSIFRILDYEMEIADLAKKNAYTYYVPTVSFVGNLYRPVFCNPNFLLTTGVAGAISTSGSLPDFLAEAYAWNIGVQFSWTFDGFVNIANAHKAEADYLNKMLTKKRTEWTVKQEVEDAYHTFRISVNTLRKKVAETHQAKQTYLKQKAALDVGLLSEAEFLVAESEWKRAEYTLAEDIGTAGIAYEDLLWQAGWPANRASLIAGTCTLKNKDKPS